MCYNRRMLKIAITLILIFSTLAAIYFFLGVPDIYSEDYAELPIPHAFGDPSRKIPEISIAAFYFVPQNKANNVAENWKEALEDSLLKLQKFHSIQFLGRSSMRYDIYETPIIGLHQSIVYDTNDTSEGNPQALKRISEEIQERVFDKTGDLYVPGFGIPSGSAYPVFAVMYEGVGSIGGVIYESEFELAGDIAKSLGLPEGSIFIVDIEHADGFFLVNRLCVTNPDQCDPGGPTLFAHEFYHTIGVPDEYEGEFQTSADIMGAGRFKAIEETYLNKRIVKKLGL